MRLRLLNYIEKGLIRMNIKNILFLFLLLVLGFDGFAQKASKTGTAYNKCPDTIQVASTRKRMEELRLLADYKVTEFLKKRYCIDNNLVSSFPRNKDRAYLKQFSERNAELGKKTELLNDLVKEPPKADKPESIKIYSDKLKALMKNIESGFNDICTEEKILCGCYSG